MGVLLSMKQTKLSYHAQLQSPEWIERAMTLKKEADWRCELCHKRQGEVKISVHHTFYVSGMMLWEYPRCLLMCLCDACHVERQNLEQAIYINVADVMRDKSNAEIMNQPIFTMFN